MAKRLSKAAKAALKASTKAPEASSSTPEVDVLKRLHEIDPSFVQGPQNRFSAEITRGKSAGNDLVAKLKDPDAEVRADAAEALGHIGDTAHLGALRGLLKDDDGEVRTNAAVALIRIGDAQLFPEVVKALRHEDPRVVIGAAVALGRLADSRVVPNLVEAFKTDSHEVGAAVAWALGQCGDNAALPWMLTALEQGFSTANVCEALGRIGDPKAQPALLGALKYASDDTRAYAARALGILKYDDGGPAGARAAQQARDRVAPELRALVKHDSARKVRLCAAIALYELGERSAGEALASELTGD